MIYQLETARTKPEILWDNASQGTSPIVSSETADGSAENSTTQATNEYWTPATVPATLQFNLAEPCPCDVVAIAAHNLGSTGCTLQLQDFGGTWNDLGALITPTDDSTIYVTFDTINLQTGLRILVDGPSVPSLGVVAIGQALRFPIGVVASYTPLNHAKEIETKTNISINGNFLGSRIRRSGLQSNIRFGGLYHNWVDANLDGFRDHYDTGNAFFIAPVPQRFPKDTGYVWRSARASGLRPTLSDPEIYDVSLDLEGYAGG